MKDFLGPGEWIPPIHVVGHYKKWCLNFYKNDHLNFTNFKKVYRF